MTGLLKQADDIRENLYTSVASKNAKSRAKVTKKCSTAHIISNPDIPVPAEDSESPVSDAVVMNNNNASKKIETRKTNLSNTQHSAPIPDKNSSGPFGGMKKGFLFAPPSNKSKTETVASSQKESAGNKEKVNTDKSKKEVKVTSEKQNLAEDIPYITPTGKTESGLAINEIQQAVSEAKGLLGSQDWITDDLLNKIEKNDSLIHQFSDPNFMKALKEYQVDPKAAMEKYKGNTEVEEFLMEFCGLLGDHFTNMNSSTGSNAKTSAPSPKQKDPLSKSVSSSPKIVEIESENSDEKPAKSGKIEIEELSADATPKKRTVLKFQTNGSAEKPQIKTRVSQQADIEEVTTNIGDAEVKLVLKDPKVMEALMDSQVMKLVQALKDDPAKGQRIVDQADGDLKEKIHFLVSKGLFQFQ